MCSFILLLSFPFSLLKRARVLLYQFQLVCGLAGFLAAVDAELVVDALNLGFDGVDGDDQLVGNLWIRATGGEQAQNAALLRAERLYELWLARGCARAGRDAVLLVKSMQERACVGLEELFAYLRQESTQELADSRAFVQKE